MNRCKRVSVIFLRNVIALFLLPLCSIGLRGQSVHEFTGGFQYGLPVLTVPGPDGSTYSIGLQYQSGTSPAAEASWVGFGWTLDPGAIARNVQGLPDDWKETIVSWNKTEDNWTVTAGIMANGEITSEDLVFGGGDTVKSLAGLKYYIRYNNKIGYWTGYSLGIDAFGYASMQYGFDQQSGRSFSASISDKLVGKGLEGLGVPAPTTAWNDWKVLGHSIITAGVASVINSIAGDAFREHNPPPMIQRPFEGKVEEYDASFLLSLPYILSGFEFGITGAYTYQRTIPHQEPKAYGYMYSGEAAESDDIVMDYSTENKGRYFKTGRFLSIPFSTRDNFFMTNGGGAFQLHNKSIGHFRPNGTNSTTDISFIGLQLHGGPGIVGLGGKLNLGSRGEYKIGRWDDSALLAKSFVFSKQSSTVDEPYFFRSLYDVGGNVLQSNTDGVQQAERASNGALSFNNVFASANDGYRSGRNTYIGYNTNKEMEESSGGIFYKAYNKNGTSRNFVDRSDPALLDKIGEITVVSAGGQRYVYGLPVHVRNEKRLLFGLSGMSLDAAQAQKIVANYLAFSNKTTDTSPIVVGEEKKNPYAISFLLTEITSPDYVDRTGDGPTPDDYGGYTKFNYRRAAGSYNKSNTDSSRYWYKTRYPYNGLSFAPNELSDPEDDMGSMSVSERELYYLESIETKTHIAYFVTNKTHITASFSAKTVNINGPSAMRLDGYEAEYHDWRATGDSLSSGIYTATDENNPSSSYSAALLNDNHLEYLDRIELYVKDGDGVPLQTVRFSYDYSLMSDSTQAIVDSTIGSIGGFEVTPLGLPNSALVAKGECSDIEISPLVRLCSLYRAGKLTLKEVWFEYGGVKNARISPYVFNYEYKASTQYAANVIGKYSDILSYGDQWTAVQQNPVYSPFNIDRWGAYQYNGVERYKRYQYWNTQNPKDGFDPGAYNLKWITLPSGGEIHVQYESNDYSFVQNREALAMVSLVADRAPGKSSMDADHDNKYYLNISDLNIDSTNQALVEYLRQKIQEMADKKEKMYFKFLYALKGTVASLEHPEYTSEYISGYANIGEVGVETINVGQPNQWFALYVRLKEADGEYDVPKQICLDLVEKTKRGKLSSSAGITRTSSGPGMVATLLGKFFSSDPDFSSGNHCKSVNYTDSYVRVPMITPKLGGGARVKRIYTYDKGIDGGAANLYGTEYRYEKFDEERKTYVSSGVATNEPSMGREENALVRFMAEEAPEEVRKKVIAGMDKQHFEGPLGESLLPRSSIGYARIVKSALHTGETKMGFSVSEYFTNKEYPVQVAHTDKIDEPSSSTIYASLGYKDIVGVGVAQIKDARDLIQGYSFSLNDMHGRPRRMAVFSGIYANPNSWFLTTQNEYEYYSPGGSLPIINNVWENTTNSPMGKDMELIAEAKAVYDYNVRKTAEGDISFSFPPFKVQGYKGTYRDEKRYNQLCSHVTTKITRSSAFIKQVRSFADGVYSTTDNIAFDANTGAPLVQRSYDGYHKNSLAFSSNHEGIYTGYTFPAFREHPALGQKAKNERAVLSSSTTSAGMRITMKNTQTVGVYEFTLRQGNNGTLPENSLARFTAETEKIQKGDLLRISRLSDNSFVGYVFVSEKIKPTAGSTDVLVTLLPASFSPSLGTLNNVVVNVEVLRSGYTNQLGVAAGSITTYGTSHLLGEAGTLQHIIGASATTFTDTPAYADTNSLMSMIESNDIEAKREGIWKPKAVYTWQGLRVAKDPAGATIDDPTMTGYRSYNSGLFKEFVPFSWQDETSNYTAINNANYYPARWVRLDSMTKFSRNGGVLEARDIHNIPTAIHMGYGNAQPVCQVVNQEYGGAFFESFEEGSFDNTAAHSGKQSLKLGAQDSVESQVGGNITPLLEGKGVLVRYWVKSTDENELIPVTLTSVVHYINPLTNTYGIRLQEFSQPKKIARTGEWTLFESDLSNWGGIGDSLLFYRMKFKNQSAGDVWVDDIRGHQPEAGMVGYVYDTDSRRVVASLDGDNFAAYNQYNAEGKLLRTRIETIRGVRTVSDAMAHVPLVTRLPNEHIPATSIQTDENRRQNAYDAENGYTPVQDILERNTEGNGAVDLLDIRLTPEQMDVQVLGTDSLNLPDNSAVVPDIGAARRPLYRDDALQTIPDDVLQGVISIEKLPRESWESIRASAVARLQALKERKAELQGSKKTASVSSRKSIDRQVREIDKEINKLENLQQQIDSQVEK